MINEEIAKIIHDYIERGIGCDYDIFNSPPPPIPIRPVKVKTLKERLEDNEMEPTSVWKIDGIDKIWITQDGDEISLLLKNRDDLTKIILIGEAIKNHNDNFITTLKADLEENEKEFSKQEKKIRELEKKIKKLEQLKTPTIENFADEEPKDNVNHPSHYTGRYECIDVMQDVFGNEATDNFCLCNAFKYIWRARKKNGLEDVKKAVWYLNKYIEEAEKDGVRKGKQI